MLDFQPALDGNGITAVFVSSTVDGVYRIVQSGGFHCLRRELPTSDLPFEWLGQFSTAAQAKLRAEKHYGETQRLIAWDRYMRKHDPPTDLGPEWRP